MQKRQATKVRKFWDKALADIACGGRGSAVVREFDRFTGDMLYRNLITMDEFVAAQTVIACGLRGGKAIDEVKAAA